MNPRKLPAAEAAADLARFDAVIDARSPAEFAEDHLPGAVNWPTLDDAERHRVGTLYAEDGALAARKVGAALAARRIAGHLDAHIAGQPRDWQPLVYCWRGGQRSGSLALVLAQIGFRTTQLEGGYKAFRAVVRQQLGELPAALRFVVIAGRTGSGKTRLLRRLAELGEPVLDLEDLARHRGSVLGGEPDRPQPTQKRFDTLVWQALRGFDPSRPVYVESESARIGALRVPEALLEAMRERSACVRVSMADAARNRLLLDEYAHFVADPEAFCATLEPLIELQGRERVRAWQDMARAGRWSELLSALMGEHYDPLYERSMRRNFARLADAPLLDLGDGSTADLDAAVGRLRRLDT